MDSLPVAALANNSMAGGNISSNTRPFSTPSGPFGHGTFLSQNLPSIPNILAGNAVGSVVFGGKVYNLGTRVLPCIGGGEGDLVRVLPESDDVREREMIPLDALVEM